MKKLLAVLIGLILLVSCGTTGANLESEYVQRQIFINQVGYLVDHEKYFIVDSTKGKFEIKNSKDHTVVYTGKVALWREHDPSSGMTVFIGDFSDFNEEGEYYVDMKDANRSFNFVINKTIYNEVRDMSIKSFYYQRSGVELLEEHVGKFAREAGHDYDLKYHKSHPIQGTKDVSGGWYDAGDYGRYITPGAVTVGLMMIGYEQYPEKFNFDNNNIPESGNGVSDFLDEVRFELEWMLKMQHTEDDQYKGALPYMVNSKSYAPSLKKGGEQYIYDFSSIATGNFAAVMASSYRNFKDIDAEFAQKCLDAAVLAWDFNQRTGLYPEDGFIRPADTTTGGYADNPGSNDDDYASNLWAAVELFLATGEDKYHDAAKEELGYVNSFNASFRWSNTIGFAKMQYILGDHEKIDTALQSKLKGHFLEVCDKYETEINNDGFKSALTQWEYVWGSNGDLLARAEMLIFAHQLTGDVKYYNASLAQLNYTLGLNVNNKSYVSGLGTSAPWYFHHATMMTDEIDEPFPGFLTGGPNYNLYDDPTLSSKFTDGTPSAQCYVDHEDSWASNENCITYSAPLIPVAAYFSN